MFSISCMLVVEDSVLNSVLIGLLFCVVLVIWLLFGLDSLISVLVWLLMLLMVIEVRW